METNSEAQAAGARLEKLLPRRFEHPEGIVWDSRRHALLWVDVFKGDVLSFDLVSNKLETASVGRTLGSVAPRVKGGLVCGVREGFGLLSPEGGFELIDDRLESTTHLQMNDGGVDAMGRFWAGSMTFEFETKPGGGALYRVDPDHTVTEVLNGISISNGIGWSPDSTRMYYVDSATLRVDDYAFDLDSGTVGERRTLAEFEALPDGLAVDVDGCIWVALFQGSRVVRITPQGDIDREVRLPATQVTTCTFGDENLDRLFIAVSPHGLEEDDPDAQAAGNIFSFEPGVQGLPTHEFGG
jgi:sugar lactone lactonase YvrE